MDRSSKQRINKDIVTLNETVDQMDLTDIYITFHPKETKNTFFSNARGTFSKIDHMIGHKISLNKFKKIKIISSIFLKSQWLEIRNQPKRKKSQKQSHSQRLNSMLLNNEGVNNKIKEEIKKFLETSENRLTTVQNLWDTAKAVLRGKFIVIQAYLKKIETFQISNLTLYLSLIHI